LAALNEAKATQLEQWVDRVPVKVRNAIALNPAKLVEELRQLHQYLKPYLRGMPYVGSVLTVGTEAYDVLSGEKSLGKAAADGSAEIAGTAGGTAAGEVAGTAAGGWVAGMLSGAEVGFIGGTAEPGLGNVVGGIAVGIVGDFWVRREQKKILHFFTG